MKMRCCSLSMPPVLVSEAVGDGSSLVVVVVLDVRVHATATTLIASNASAARRTNMAAESIGDPFAHGGRRCQAAAQRVRERALPSHAGSFGTMPDHEPPLRCRRDRAAMGRSV